MNKTIIKDAVTLCLITLIAGVFLGFVYEVTKNPIKEQQEKKKQEAYQTVFEEAESFEDYEDVTAVDEYVSGLGYSDSVDEIVSALDGDGTILGYVITVTSSEGYGGDITISVGITTEGMINGTEILSISETPNLGMKAKDSEFKDQFNDKTVTSFEYTKTGSSEDNQIDAISGATITTKAFTNGINASLEAFRYIGGATNE